MSVLKKDFLYEGKAKRIFSSSISDKVIIEYKDDATAFNAQKKGKIHNKGVLNNKITELIFIYLNSKGIESHFVERLSEREQLCTKVSIIPFEVIARNIIAGSTAKKFGLEEGIVLDSDKIIYELCYKKDELEDPLMNDYHAIAMELATPKELNIIYSITKNINEILTSLFSSLGIILVDFKLEFGKDSKGNILLADEISPDTCRFWEKNTLRKMDKDRFRRDLGKVEEAYQEIYDKLSAFIK